MNAKFLNARGLVGEMMQYLDVEACMNLMATSKCLRKRCIFGYIENLPNENKNKILRNCYLSLISTFNNLIDDGVQAEELFLNIGTNFKWQIIETIGNFSRNLHPEIKGNVIHLAFQTNQLLAVRQFSGLKGSFDHLRIEEQSSQNLCEIYQLSEKFVLESASNSFDWDFFQDQVTTRNLNILAHHMYQIALNAAKSNRCDIICNFLSEKLKDPSYFSEAQSIEILKKTIQVGDVVSFKLLLPNPSDFSNINKYQLVEQALIHSVKDIEFVTYIMKASNSFNDCLSGNAAMTAAAYCKLDSLQFFTNGRGMFKHQLDDAKQIAFRKNYSEIIDYLNNISIIEY